MMSCVVMPLFCGFSRQTQNLRDELYQAKLRLEKETAALKEANKVSRSGVVFKSCFNNEIDH